MLMPLPRKISSHLLTVPAALIWAFAVFLSQLNLLNNDFWEPGTLSVAGLHMKTIEMFYSRTTLNRFELHGGQALFRSRVRSVLPYHPSKLSLEFEITSPIGWVALGYRETPQGTRGIRLSASDVRPSEFFVIDEHEKITEREKIPLRLTRQKTNHTLSLTQEAAELSVRVDGKEVARLKDQFAQSRIRLEASQFAAIRNVRLEDADGTQALTFGPRIGLGRLFTLNLAGFLALSIGFLAFTKRDPMRFLLSLSLAGILWVSFDYFHHSNKSFRWNPREEVFEPLGPGGFNFEGLRGRFFDAWAGLVQKRIRPGVVPPVIHSDRKNLCTAEACVHFEKFPKDIPKSPGRKRILLIGGSLNSGFGASAPERISDMLLFRKLQESHPHIELLTYSIPVHFIRPEDARYALALIEASHPDLVVFEIDLDKIHRPHFEEVLARSRSQHRKMVYLRRPMDFTSLFREDLPRIRKRIGLLPQRVLTEPYRGAEVEPYMRKLIDDYGLGYLDAREDFIKEENFLSAQLFWDAVHLSDTGHELLALFLAKKFTQLL